MSVSPCRVASADKHARVGSVDRCIGDWRELACFDNVDVDRLPRTRNTARFVIGRLEHLGGRRGVLLATRLRRALTAEACGDVHAS